MGTEFSLGCLPCKLFIALHKWPIVEEAASYVVHSHYEEFASYYDLAMRPENSPFPIRSEAILQCGNAARTSNHP